MRDKNTKYDFVPCASCMSRLFDTYMNTKPSQNLSFYLHSDYSTHCFEYAKRFPLLFNKDNKTFEEIIQFIADPEILVTNSYHGAYWGALLQKRVVLVSWSDKNGNCWFSDKFKQFPFKHTVCANLDELPMCVENTEPNYGVLEFSRQKNIEFKNKVMNNI